MGGNRSVIFLLFDLTLKVANIVSDSSIIISSFQVKMSKSVSIHPHERWQALYLMSGHFFLPSFMFYTISMALTKNNDDCIWSYYDPVMAIFAIKPHIVFITLTQQSSTSTLEKFRHHFIGYTDTVSGHSLDQHKT